MPWQPSSWARRFAGAPSRERKFTIDGNILLAAEDAEPEGLSAQCGLEKFEVNVAPGFIWSAINLTIAGTPMRFGAIGPLRARRVFATTTTMVCDDLREPRRTATLYSDFAAAEAALSCWAQELTDAAITQSRDHGNMQIHDAGPLAKEPTTSGCCSMNQPWPTA